MVWKMDIGCCMQVFQPFTWQLGATLSSVVSYPVLGHKVIFGSCNHMGISNKSGAQDAETR